MLSGDAQLFLELYEAGGAYGSAIGSGFQNTLDIEESCTEPETAADICSNLSLNGYTDWFLPSIDELNLIYQKKSTIDFISIANGGDSFSTNSDCFYWSSTQNDVQTAITVYFTDGGRNFIEKDEEHRVRAIRAF